MSNKIEFPDYDLDVIMLALKGCISANERAVAQFITDDGSTEHSSPQNEVMQELLDRIEKVELFK